MTPANAGRVDAALICTDHDAVDFKLLVEATPLVVDTRNVCGRSGLLRGNVVKTDRVRRRRRAALA